MEWHNLKDNASDLPKENEEVICLVENSLFKYNVMVYLNGDWKGFNVPDNRANIVAWAYIE